MNRVHVFVNVSLDGYFAGPNDEIDWFKTIKADARWEAHTRAQSRDGSTLLMGRTTYTMMKSFWPTHAGRSSDPHMARVMNESPKLVVSKTLTGEQEDAHWKNVTVIRNLDADTLRNAGGDSITILGSGSVVQQLGRASLIDEYELVIVPIVLGAGKPLFEGSRIEMKLLEAQSFDNGLVSLRYAAA